EDRRQRLISHTDEVDFRLLVLQGATSGLGVEAEFPGSFAASAVFFAHRLGPKRAGRAILGDFFKDIIVRIEEKAHPRSKGVDGESASETGIDIVKPIGERERQLL